MNSRPRIDAGNVVARLCAATAAHDVEGIVACFAVEYRNETPAHPERGFTGRDQVRRNWVRIFEMVPDISPEILRFVVDGDSVWSEWEHRGTRIDGGQHLMRGVIIFGVTGDVISWTRFYVEPVDEGSQDADAFRERLIAAKDLT
jgi:hypothetical protein